MTKSVGFYSSGYEQLAQILEIFAGVKTVLAVAV